MICDTIRDLTAVELEAVGGGSVCAFCLAWSLSETVVGAAGLQSGAAALAGAMQPPPPPPPVVIIT